MSFDPGLVDKFKKPSLPPVPGGFDPSLVDKFKAQGKVPREPLIERVKQGLDFARRSFMGDEIAPAGRNTFQNLMRDATDFTTGTSHLLGQTLVEGSKLGLDAAKSVGPMVMSSIIGPPTAAQVSTLPQTPLGQRVQAFPGQLKTAVSSEGRAIAGPFVKDVAREFGKSFGYEQAKAFVKKPSVDTYKAAMVAPIKQFHEHPLFTFIDWTTVGSVAGQGVKASLKVAGKTAKAAGAAKTAGSIENVLSTARESLPVAPRGQISREFSTNPLVKYGIQKPFDKVAANEAIQGMVSNSPALKSIAPTAMLTPEARAGRVSEKVMGRAQSEFYMKRNQLMQEAQDKFSSLPKHEQEAFIPIVQGRAIAISKSPKFKEVYDWYKNNVLDEQQKLGLTDETVKRVAYQPLIISQGLLTQGDYALALKGNTEAIAKVTKVTDDFAQARVRVQEQAFREFLTKDTPKPKFSTAFKQGDRIYEGRPGETHADVMTRVGQETAKGKLVILDAKEAGFVHEGKFVSREEASRIANATPISEGLSGGGAPRAKIVPGHRSTGVDVRRMAKQLTEATAPDPIYFPSIFADKIKMADFLPSKFLQKFKPGFMKGRTGAFGFIEKDPAAAFSIHQAQVEKYLKNESLILSIKDKFAEPLAKASDLKPGYKVFAPDGYLGFYKGAMPLQEAFLRGVGMGENVDAAFLAAVQKVMPTMVQDKTYIGVRRPKLYQVPAEVAENLQTMMMPGPKMPEMVKLLWDKPLQAFKFSVLAMAPRWIVNNTVGNIMLIGMGRVSPESFIKAGKSAFKELIPPEVLAGGFRRTEFPHVQRVITPQTGATEKFTGFFSGRTPTEGNLKSLQNVVSTPIKGILKFGDSVFEVNAKIEDAFRSATFIDKVSKAAVEVIAKKTATGIFNMKQGLNRFLERGEFADSKVAKLAGQMLKDDAFRMSMVDETNRILNDYNKMSPFERNIVRRAVPFWSWWKFMTTTFWSMPVKDPAMAQTIKLMSAAGTEIAKSEWKANGLDIKEIPEWMAGNVILGILPEDQMMQMLNTRSINPLSTAKEWPGLAPQVQLIFERMTGRKFPFGTPFTSPYETETSPGTVYRKGKQGVERLQHPTPPPLISHILRQLPQVQMAESLAFPYRTYTGEGIGSNAIRAYKGKETKLKPHLRLANILGLPVAEADYKWLKKSKTEAKRAGRKIDKQISQSNRSLEKVKLGPR